MESTYVRVAGTTDVPIGRMKVVKSDGKEILIVNVNGNFYAIANRCTHQGTDLSQGKLEGNIIECPKHHARFDVTTGKLVSKPKIGFVHVNADDETTYQIKVENENIMVKL